MLNEKNSETDQILSSDDEKDVLLLDQLSALFLDDLLVLAQVELSEDDKDMGENLSQDLLTDNLCEV